MNSYGPVHIENPVFFLYFNIYIWKAGWKAQYFLVFFLVLLSHAFIFFHPRFCLKFLVHFLVWDTTQHSRNYYSVLVGQFLSLVLPKSSRIQSRKCQWISTLKQIVKDESLSIQVKPLSQGEKKGLFLAAVLPLSQLCYTRLWIIMEQTWILLQSSRIWNKRQQKDTTMR